MSTEAMKLALDALERCEKRFGWKPFVTEDTSDSWKPAEQYALEAIAALRQAIAHPAQVPAGYKLVPIEPTQAQAKAAADAWLDCGSKLILNKAQAAVRASVAAAPGVK